jgi:hypothetical protein
LEEGTPDCKQIFHALLAEPAAEPEDGWNVFRSAIGKYWMLQVGEMQNDIFDRG